MKKPTAAKKDDNEALILELMERLDAADKAARELAENLTAFGEGVAGRLLKLEDRMGALDDLTKSEDAGAPDMLCRRLLAGFLKLLDQQWAEFTTARQATAKEIIALGKPLMTVMTVASQRHGHMDKQQTVKELTNDS